MGNPLVVIHRVQPGIELAKDDLHVADDAGVHLDILVNLRRINIQLENLCVLCKFRRVAGHTVAEPGPHHNQQVGLGYAEVGGLGTVHAHHACVQLVSPVKSALSHQAVRHRRLNLMGKCPQLVGRVGQHSAAAHKDKRFCRLADHLHGPVHILLCNGIALAHDFLRNLLLIFTERGRHILGDIHQHRAGTSCLRYGKRPADDRCQTAYILYNEIILCNGHGHARNVDFLETVLAQQAVGHVAGDGHHRHGIHISGSDACHQIGSTRAGCGQTHAHLAGGPCVAVGCMGSPLLVRCQDMGDFIPVLVQCIIYIQDSAARITKYGVHTLFLQTRNYNLCPRQFAHICTPFLHVIS